MEPRLRLTIDQVERMPIRLILQSIAMCDALAWLDEQAKLDAAADAALRDAQGRLRGR